MATMIKGLIQKITNSPALTRAVPFIVFILLTALQGKLGDASRFWFYLVKSLAGAWLLWSLRSLIPEMKWKLSWEAVVAGVLVLVIWIGLDGYYPKPGKDEPWNPHVAFGQGSFLAWFFIVVRICGASLVVPVIEEIFFRSFVYRWIANQDFLSVPLSKFFALPFFLTAIIFASEHREWLPGLFCAFIYQGLVLYKGRLGDAITAHAITNFLLGLYVVWKGAWIFW